MEQQQIARLRAIQTKLADAAEITSQDVQDMAMIVRLYPSMVHRTIYGMVSGRHQAQQETDPVQVYERPTAEQLEAARKAAAANPTAANLTTYATLKRQAGE